MYGCSEHNQSEMLDTRTSERLGARLRQARQMRGMTLRVLADAASCSESLLSKIENCKAYPSLPMLSRLVKSLDVGMGWLFDDHDSKEPIIFRAGQRSAATGGATQGSAASAGAASGGGQSISVEQVIPDTDRHALRCKFLHVDPGAASGGDHQQAGEEVGYLVDGQIELLIVGRPHRLNAGDAFAFRSDQPHRYRNVGATRASLFLVSSTAR